MKRWLGTVALLAAGCSRPSVEPPAAPAIVAPGMVVSGWVHEPLTSFYYRYVDDGLVDYAGLAADERWPNYLASLARFSRADLPDAMSAKAFYLNAYNALVIEGVLRAAEDGRFRSPAELGGGREASLARFFGEQTFTLAGETVTLDQLAGERILGDDPDPRLPAAMVRAARGGPLLSREPWPKSEAELNLRLDTAVRLFLTDPARNRLEPKTGRVRLSAVWRDQAAAMGGAQALRESLADYLDAERAALLRDESVATEWLELDWRLNQALPGADADPAEP